MTVAVLSAAIVAFGCAAPGTLASRGAREQPSDAGAEGTAALASEDAGTGPNSPPSGGAADQGIVVIAGGDVTLGYHFGEYFDEQISKGQERAAMFEYAFREVKGATQKADLFVVNLECPFTSRGEKIAKNFNFRARPELVSVLLAGGVGAVSLANNHLMDYGPVGVLDSLATLDSAHLPHFGAGRNLAEARRPAIIERRGVRIALLGYFFLGDHNIEPEALIATEDAPGVAGHHSNVELMERMLREDVALARSQADLVIPFFHWGREGNHVPEAYQIRLAHAAIDEGAAAVLGSHPHVLQGMELYRGAPIVYSLGNFVFGGNWNPKEKEGALFKSTFSRTGYLASEVIPLRIDRFPQFPMQPIVLEGGPADEVLKHLTQYSRGFARSLR